jgi:hypothetical protein
MGQSMFSMKAVRVKIVDSAAYSVAVALIANVNAALIFGLNQEASYEN